MANSKCFLVVLLIVYSINLVSSASIRYNELFKLDIVHFNDFHARFEETTVDFPVCESNDTTCLGGFSRLYHEINTILVDKPDALVLNAGDSFQGTYWYSLLKWNVTQMFINLLPIDAHAIGNHEFDDGVAGLAPYLASLRAPVVAANVDVSGEPKLDGLLQSSIIVERHGREIGIIGLITVETATGSNPGNVVFLDPIETTKREAALLADKGVEIIILLSHCGLQIDKEIAEKVGEHVDVIVGGHSHSLLWNGTAPSFEEVSGPYPILIEREDNHKVLVVTASAFTKYLGNITVFFNEDGEIKGFEGNPVFLDRSIPEDPEVNALLQPFTEELHKLVQTEVGQTKEELNMESCGQEECAFGNLVANAFRDRTLQKNLSSLPHLAIILRNSIRGSLPQGNISRGALINAFPFRNQLSTFVIEGQYIVEALEHTMTNFWTKEPFSSPWLPHVAGMRVVLNPADQKVVSVGIKHGEDYREMEPMAFYQVTTFDFISAGRSGFTMLKDHAKNVTDLGEDRVVIEEYIKKESPIRPNALLDNRLIIVN